MDTIKTILFHAQEGSRLRESYITAQAPAIDEAANRLARCLRENGKILVAGNGGSASDAQHMTGELVGRFLTERRALPAIALSVDTSVLTAVSNDYGFEQVFARQVQALGRAGDVFVGISTSGNSPNILRALEYAREQGMYTIGLTGKNGGAMPALCHSLFHVPHDHTPFIQEVHAALIHLFCELIDIYLLEQSAR